MRYRTKSQQLKELAHIRELQRVRAETEAIRASTRLQTSKEKLTASEEAAENTALYWQVSVSADWAALELTTLWSDELRKRDAAVQLAATAVLVFDV